MEFGKNNVADQEKPALSPGEGRDKKPPNPQLLVENPIADENRTPERPRLAQGNNKDDLRARYWSYLFDNLQRAVDEIYKTCDNDESIVECEVR